MLFTAFATVLKGNSKVPTLLSSPFTDTYTVDCAKADDTSIKVRKKSNIFCLIIIEINKIIGCFSCINKNGL